MSKKINKLRIINYGQISDVEIIPKKNVVTVTGKNGHGKTTVLNAINHIVFGGGLEEPVIKTGEKRSDIIAEIDDYIISWRKTQKSPPQVEIRNKSDNKKIGTTRAVISDILGSKLLADPLALMNEKDPKKQRKMFIELLELDTTQLDFQEKYQRDKRQDTGREIKRLEGYLKSLSYDPDVKRVNTIELMDQLNAANKVNKTITDNQDDLVKKKERYKTLKGNVENLKNEIEKLEGEMEEIKQAGEKIKVFLKDTCSVETAIIEDQIKKADGVNEIVRNNIEYEKAIKDREAQEDQYTIETNKITKICGDRDQLLQSKNLSSLNLSITPDAILWKDLPLQKASTGQKITLGINFLIMLNPEFLVFWIEDGDKLDNDNYKLIEQIAGKNPNIQIWIESVSRLDVDNAIVLEGGSIIKGGGTGNGKKEEL